MTRAIVAALVLTCGLAACVLAGTSEEDWIACVADAGPDAGACDEE